MAESVSDFFAALPSKINPERISGMNATFQFNLTGDDGGAWHVAIANDAATVHEGAAATPNITITISAADWLDMINGKLSGQAAFLTGRLKVQGDMGLALKLQALLQP